MKRRDFIKQSSLASGFFMLPGFLKPLENLSSVASPKKLVVVQLSGGNDWLNTIVPYKNDLYYKLRPTLSIKEQNLVKLQGELAFHSALVPLKEFYDNGEMAIVNNVGYPNPDRSHFRSTDIWHTASSGNEYLHTGWIGRYLDNNCTSAYEALEMNNNLSLALKGKKLNGIATLNIKQLYKETKSPFFETLANPELTGTLADDNQAYLYKTLLDAGSSASYLFEKHSVVNNSKEYPNTGFAKQLKNIASLIGADSGTRVYYTVINGFDTHVGQQQKHERLLKNYAEALSVFINNLKELNHWEDTLILTFSEFGRRVEENASKGTDHGAAGNVFLFGKNLKKNGIVNELPDLANLDDGDLRFSMDFRSIYKDVLKNWLQADADKIIPASVKTIELV